MCGFYAVKKISQVRVEVVVNLHYVLIRLFAEQYPAAATEHLNVSAVILGKDPVYNVAKRFLAADPTDKAINKHHLLGCVIFCFIL